MRTASETPPPSYAEVLKVEESAKVRNNNLSNTYGPIIWPTEPFDAATADFMANAIPAGYEDYNSDNEYLKHWL